VHPFSDPSLNPLLASGHGNPVAGCDSAAAGTGKRNGSACDIEAFLGLVVHESGTHVNGTPPKNLVDVLAAYNAVNDPDLSPDAGWTPTLFLEIQPTGKVPSAVQSDAGPFNW
jgi:hypothetical protein